MSASSLDLTRKITAIFWDIGGVLVRTEDRSPRARLAQSLGTTYEDLEELVWGGERGRLAQCGHISEPEQWRFACRSLGLDEGQAGWLKSEFFAGDRVDYELAHTIRQLRQDYKTGVISNAMSDARRFLEEEAGIADAFDHLTYSYAVGIMKPQREIFEAALQASGVEAAQAVFVDDYGKNVTGARETGMQAVHFKSREQALQDLESILGKKLPDI
jgi:putative hydrolase of the HAD superfamily